MCEGTISNPSKRDCHNYPTPKLAQDLESSAHSVVQAAAGQPTGCVYPRCGHEMPPPGEGLWSRPCRSTATPRAALPSTRVPGAPETGSRANTASQSPTGSAPVELRHRAGLCFPSYEALKMVEWLCMRRDLMQKLATSSNNRLVVALPITRNDGRWNAYSTCSSYAECTTHPWTEFERGTRVVGNRIQLFRLGAH